MRARPHTSSAERSFAIPILVLVLLVVFALAGCSGPPRLTAEDRRSDIQFLADWARHYSPFAELNEKYKNTPSYEALLPRYLEFAEQAETDEEFYQVVSGYFRVIGASGHFYLLDEEMLRLGKIATFLGIVKLDITPGQCERGRYWSKLARGVSSRAHPPFHVEFREGKYFTGDDWQHEGTAIPRGSEILKVDGKTCSAYLDYVKSETPLKYDAYPKDWVDNWLMIIDEGPSFRGWQVEFGLPDGRVVAAFAPKVGGWPAPKEEPVRTEEPEANCTCLELTEDVGYVRVRMFMSGYLSYFFRGNIKKDRNKIKAFLDRSDGQYRKLIIDVRNNGGGLPQYAYDALMSPFLDEPATYSQLVGLKTKYLADTGESVVRFLRKDVSNEKAHAIRVTEAEAPESFDPNHWTFYHVTRRIEPRHRYNFTGGLYILMNGGCYSAADDYLNAVKRIGFATLVGQNSGGGAAGYVAPPFITLPASGMAFRVETDLVINPDGSYNEISGTPPDVELPVAGPPKSITREDLLEDKWIQWILADAEDRTAGYGVKAN